MSLSSDSMICNLEVELVGAESESRTVERLVIIDFVLLCSVDTLLRCCRNLG